MTFAGLESQEAGLLVASHLLAAFVSALLAVYVGWAHRERALGRVFALLLGALTVWTLGSAAKLFSPDPGTYVALSVVQYVGITLATALLFLFALLYDGRDRWVTRRVVAAVLVVPVLTLLVLATTRHHELFYTAIVEVPLGGTTVQTSRVGPLFWAWTGYGWALLLVGSALVVNAGFKRSAFYRVQSSLVILGVGVSWAVNAAFIAFGWPHPAVDPTPLGLTVTGLLFTAGIFTTRLVDLVPAVRSRVLDAIDDAVIAIDPQGRIVDVNDPARRLLGDDVSFGQPAAEALPAALVGPVGAGRTTVELGEDGDRTVYQYRRLPVGPDGVHGEVIVLTELTDLVRARRELERQNERLEEFASVVSHDLRNPLAIARGNLELARGDGDLARLDDVEAAHDRMERLIDDLLSLARDGRLVGQTEVVDLATAARDAWGLVEAPDATLALGDGLAAIRADPDRLQQLLENLFSNAVEHGGSAVTVRVRATEGGFAVEDDGAGLDAEDPERAFDHGYTTSNDGTGFGLAIVRSVAEAHGWEVEVAESPEGGLRLAFTGVEPG